MELLACFKNAIPYILNFLFTLPHWLVLMAIWPFPCNTTSHKAGIVVPSISFTHGKKVSLITLPVELTFFQATSHHLYSKTSPYTSLLFHFPNSSPFSWPPRLCFFATIPMFLPCSPLFGEASKGGGPWEHPKHKDFLLHLKVSPPFPFSHTQAPPCTLSLSQNTPTLRSKLPNICSFPFTHFSTSYSEGSCSSSPSQAVPWLSLLPHSILAILASRASLSRWNLKAIQCQWCSHINTLTFLLLWLS